MAVPETTSVGKAADIAKFFRESKLELKKVTWPTKQELIVNTIIVLIAVFICAFSIWIVDSVFSVLIRALLQ